MKPRDPYKYDRDQASRESGVADFGPGVTQQQFKDDADINNIVRRYMATGLAPVNQRAPLPEDFYGIFDFQSAMNAVRSSQEAFAAMPSAVRLRFGNNPAEFVEFCLDPENREEMARMGLASPGPALPEIPPEKGGETLGEGGEHS